MKDWIRNRETRMIRGYEYGTDNLEMPITKLGGKDMEMKIKKWKRTVGKKVQSCIQTKWIKSEHKESGWMLIKTEWKQLCYQEPKKYVCKGIPEWRHERG